jgi:hypothetical protein
MRWIWLLSLLFGCAPKLFHPHAGHPGVAEPTDLVVQLRRIPVLAPVGVHYFFVVYDPGDGWHRWEWLSSGEKNSIRQDAMPLDGAFGRPRFCDALGLATISTVVP